MELDNVWNNAWIPREPGNTRPETKIPCVTLRVSVCDASHVHDVLTIYLGPRVPITIYKGGALD